MIETSIPLSAFKACSIALSKDYTRTSICGYNLRGDKSRGLYLTATDGRCLVSIRMGEWGEDSLNVILKPFMPQGRGKIKLQIDTEKKTVRYKCGLEPTFDLIDEKYPTWEDVIPEDAGTAPSIFDVNRMEPLIKAAKMYSGCSSGMDVCSNGSGAAVLRLSNDDSFLGVLMPLRGEVKLDTRDILKNFRSKEAS